MRNHEKNQCLSSHRIIGSFVLRPSLYLYFPRTRTAARNVFFAVHFFGLLKSTNGCLQWWRFATTKICLFLANRFQQLRCCCTWYFHIVGQTPDRRALLAIMEHALHLFDLGGRKWRHNGNETRRTEKNQRSCSKIAIRKQLSRRRWMSERVRSRLYTKKKALLVNTVDGVLLVVVVPIFPPFAGHCSRAKKHGVPIFGRVYVKGLRYVFGVQNSMEKYIFFEVSFLRPPNGFTDS